MDTPSALLRLATSALVTLGALTPAARSGVLVVDPAGGGDFTDPQAAIAAAADGDIILIEAGNYVTPSNLLSSLGKAITLVGDSADLPILPPVLIQGVPPGKTVVLRHLSFQPNAVCALLGGTVFLNASHGRVHIEDCTIQGLDSAQGFPGLRTSSVNGVAVHRCTITGGAGGSAIQVSGDPVSLYFVDATGGAGGAGTAEDAAGQPGGHAIHSLAAAGAHVIVSGCTLTGGDGGAGTPTGAAGNGVFAAGPGFVLGELDSTIAGGASGQAVNLPGDALHDVWAGSAVSLVVSAPVRSQSSGTLSVSGPPNELFALFFSLGMGYLPTSNFHGTFLPASPFFGPLLVVSTNGAGAFTAPFLAPSLLPFGLEGLLTVNQALMLQDQGLVLSNASAYIQVEPPN